MEGPGRSGASAASRVEAVERSGGGGTAVVMGGAVMVVMGSRSESAMNTSVLVSVFVCVLEARLLLVLFVSPFFCRCLFV